MRVVVAASVVDPLQVLAAFDNAHADSGATASFVGRCRAMAGGQPVLTLELQHYPGLTEGVVEAFARHLSDELHLDGLLVVHRVGLISPRETIVVVAAASARRAEALAGVEMMIDFLKTDAPFWKRETTAVGAKWIEPSDADYARRAAAGLKP